MGNDRQDRSDEKLRDILEAAERRKAEAWKKTSHKATLWIGIPMAALLLWAVVFLIRYRAQHPPVDKKPAAVAALAEPQLTDEQKVRAQYDAFLPEAQRVVKPTNPKPESAPMIDKGDIDFAIQLLNFGQSANKQPPKKP